MEIVRSQRRNGSDGSGDAASLPLYKSAPSLEVRLEEFERCAIDRLRVLKAISDGLSRGKKPEEMDNLVGELWRANMKHQDADETLRKDIISHFALRLVYCREEEMRRWFLSMETTLFRYRFRLQNAEAQKSIMNELHLQYNVLSHAEYETIKDKLIQAARSVNSTSNPETVFYKVPFEDVPDLVASRRVFLLKGFAFVPRNQVVSLVCTIFRSNISKALALTNRKWRATIHDQEKDRLAPIVEALGNSYLGPDYSQPRECVEISLKDINQLASSSFPLCMRHLFGKLREDHHLKHGGRMQLGLFLKGVGLKLEDALAFWRAEFSQKVGAERFDKEYAYSIRHNYGKEGKRTDYTPYSCQKIIMSTPSTGDHHGCPFRHFSEENLRAALNKMGVGGRAMDDIMDKVRNRHYQLACTLTFEATHAASCETGINHPNQYFVESRKIFQSKNQQSQPAA